MPAYRFQVISQNINGRLQKIRPNMCCAFLIK